MQADQIAYETLPSLKMALDWYHADLVIDVTYRAARASTPRLREVLSTKAAKLKATPPWVFRQDYLAERAREIMLTGTAELEFYLKRLGRTWKKIGDIKKSA